MKMIINGKKTDSVCGLTFQVIAPATGAVIDIVPKATEEDIKLAITAAEKGQKLWLQIPLYKRAKILYKFLDSVEENKEMLAQLLCQENGKPIKEARNEIKNIHIAFSGFIERAKHFYGQIIPPGSEQGHVNNLQLVTREPIGIITCIIPFNFPCDLFNHKVAPALLMGNAAIVLPSSENPLTIMKLTEMLVEAGVTDGAIQCLTAPGPVKSTAITDPRIDLITLTGSTEVGINTAKLAAMNLKRVALELGGNDAFIVLDDADIDLAIKEMIWGRMYNAGQICCGSKRFLIHHSVKEEFIRKAIDKIKDIIIGPPESEETQISCLISEKAAIKVEAEVNLTVNQGGKILLGGKRTGAFYQPTILADVPKTADVAKNLEIFGPVVSIIEFNTDEEAIEIANSSIYGLSSCVFSRDIKRAMQISSAIQAGEVVINGSGFLRSFEMPFGGWKFSGIGTEGVMSSFEEMTKIKTIVLKDMY